MITHLATITSEWDAFLPMQKAFYGIGYVAAFLIVLLAICQVIGIEFHLDFDHPDHGGASLFSVKPIVGFFFGMGWAGGFFITRVPVAAAFGIALVAGFCAMVLIWSIVKTFVHFQNDGSMVLQSAVGKDAFVYKTIDPKDGGFVQVTLNTGLETLAAITREKEPISTGKTVTVIQLDGPNLLVETKKENP